MRLDDIITIIGDEIPARQGTKTHAGYVALQKCDGKAYREFRILAGGSKGEPNRKFSPSAIRKHAEATRFAAFGAGTPKVYPSAPLPEGRRIRNKNAKSPISVSVRSPRSAVVR